jgi:NitT/TauT family transport system ATP-binding protein
MPVSLPQPRNRLDAAFRAIVDEIYSILTLRITEAIGAQSQIRGGLVQPLRPVSIDRISGFLETLASPTYDGHAELDKIARPLALEINDLFPIAAALHILEFAELRDGTITLTAAGRLFAESGTEERKRLFREHLIHFVPLAAHIQQVITEREDHQPPLERFALELQDHLNQHEAASTLQVIIDWGRYAESFTYDDRTRTFGPLQSQR